MKKIIKTLILALTISTLFGPDMKATGNLANIEAMFIYNFLRHVNWPETNTSSNFVIGVYGNSEIYEQLVQFTNNRKVGAKSIEVRKINSPADASSCQLIFVPSSNYSKISALKGQLGNTSCLIVGEKEGSNAAGSTIEFVFQENTLKFRINEERAKQQNLLVSKALLDMAIN